MPDWLIAIVLGILEGLTEFIPVSSTGHLILAQAALKLTGVKSWDVFIILIQLGAILAVVALYFQRLWSVVIRLPRDPRARHFALSVFIAFLPAMGIGFLLHKQVEAFLDSPKLICVTLIIGGLVLLIIDRWKPRPRHVDAMRFPLLTALGIGLFQCLALIPGTSRSGATIVGATLLGCDKRSSAEFSFFLAIPTMLGVFVYDAWKNRHMIDVSHAELIVIGFVTAFLSGLIVVRWMLDFVSRRGFSLFGVWRIVVGVAGLALLTWGGR